MLQTSQFDTDWGQEGSQMTGGQVQQFIKQQFKELIGAANALESAQETLQKGLNNLQKDNSSMTNNVNNLNTQLSGLSSTLGLLQTQLTGISNQCNAINQPLFIGTIQNSGDGTGAVGGDLHPSISVSKAVYGPAAMDWDGELRGTFNAPQVHFQMSCKTMANIHLFSVVATSDDVEVTFKSIQLPNASNKVVISLEDIGSHALTGVIHIMVFGSIQTPH